MTVGDIVRRHGEMRQYRVIGVLERVKVGAKVLLAILEPLHESMTKRVYVPIEDLVKVM